MRADRVNDVFCAKRKQDAMLPKTQAQHHAQGLTGIKGALHIVETGLKIYNSLRGVYEVGKAHASVYPGLKDWFRALYQVLLGQDEGPRMGSFIVLYGVGKTVAMIEDVLEKRPEQSSRS